jgi:hypothetical protein
LTVGDADNLVGPAIRFAGALTCGGLAFLAARFVVVLVGTAVSKLI